MFAKPNQASGSSINLFLKPAPSAIQKEVNQELEKTKLLNTKSASKIGKKILKNGFQQFFPTPAGFIALYGGYVDYSDPDGNITFPLLHKTKKIYLVITPEITLTPIHGQTFSHKNIIPGKPIKRYLFQQKVDRKKIPFWQVTEQDRPENNVISPLSIVLLTKPENIVVPTGDFMATKQLNLILPHVYAVGNSANEANLLNFLDIRRYFEQIEREEKIATEKIKQSVITNN